MPNVHHRRGAAGFAVVGNTWKTHVGHKMGYLMYDSDDRWYEPVVIPLRFLLLLSLFIPISLKVCGVVGCIAFLLVARRREFNQCTGHA